MEIRAATIKTALYISQQTGLSPSEVDGWFFTKRNEIKGPFHLCITSNY